MAGKSFFLLTQEKNFSNNSNNIFFIFLMAGKSFFLLTQEKPFLIIVIIFFYFPNGR